MRFKITGSCDQGSSAARRQAAPAKAITALRRVSVGMIHIKVSGRARRPTTPLLILEKYSLGIGDRFAHQARAQLEAFRMAAARGAAIVPVWNKSNREHLIVGS